MTLKTIKPLQGHFFNANQHHETWLLRGITKGKGLYGSFCLVIYINCVVLCILLYHQLVVLFL